VEWQQGKLTALLLASRESVLRRAYREDDALRLEAANPRYKTMRVTDAEIYGVVVLVQRRVK